ncbi:poly-beta-1,6-N-acetyl-D-glucosamine synthase [Variovorax sp.]|jgi:poly-beta-1,6-N-acetyl-D-glucosamine synthase|uniref:poly-beta-1,6-N-acetyl-D-glucosamine synthase n=1 Tax=Variovorax sp. TaxID=1871043 RepID=UPI00120B1FF2|nr:poly-beta-1,6-N-acetyl-D-glucosamine synthase [Variovorax sp.]TAJ57270.1 MAG: poly-beta-1,6 N-acetyl-D-glucosamine synthase [Variovorax sp.]
MNPEFFGSDVVRALLNYVFYYPFLAAYVWMAGGLAHALVFERGRHRKIDPLPLLPEQPLVSVIVPCFNEGERVQEVIEQLMRSHYPNYEVIAVNDGSSDDTGAILDALATRYGQLRVVHHATNQGKAVALNTAAVLANGEYILGVDGDALVDPDAIAWMLTHMLHSERVGAVTGNPRIRGRTTLLGRMQVGEFSSNIGLIKRTQQLAGRLFTVSGVLSMFRRNALLDVDFWSPDVMTEDIDISWKLQLKDWRVRYEPRALCWILMPETVRGLYRQRQRWATGGIQTLLRYTGQVIKPRNFMMWPVFLEYLASVVWAYAMFAVLVLALVRRFLPPEWQYVGFWPEWHGMLLGITCMLQMGVSLWIDRHYDRDILRYLVWTIWYPLAFWMINMFTTVVALPATILRRKGKRARWTSPDRGVIANERSTASVRAIEHE